MAKSDNVFSRRSLVVGTLAGAASAALPISAQAKSVDPWVTAKLAAMSQAMDDIHIMEVKSNSFAPYYRKVI